jgi:hypothetical protein
MLAWFKKKFSHPSAPGVYGYHQARIFDNGAQQVTFEFHKTLPQYTAIGPATAVQSVLMIQQPSQVWNPLSVPTSGIGGLQAGALVSQPLVNSDFTPIE